VEELIKTVSEKAGINPEQAKAAVNSVLDFLKTKVPLVGEQVQGVLKNGNGSIADATEVLKKRFGF
jgi:hypothetical protein